MKRTAWGLAALALYGAAVVWAARTGVAPARPLYDGLAPAEPYRYVSPPSDLADANRPPEPLDQPVEFTEGRIGGWSVNTADGQVQLAVPIDGIAPREGEPGVRITIDPLDPALLPAPGEPLVVQGNAYALGARYASSEEDVELTLPVTLVLRYPVHAATLLHLRDGRWREIPATASSASLQLFAEIEDLGTYAAAGPPVTERRWVPFAAAGAGLVAAIAGYLSGRGRLWRRRKTTRQMRRQRMRRRK